MFDVDVNIKTWLPTSAIEPAAMRQIENIASMPFLFKHVAVMPDCHLGKGATGQDAGSPGLRLGAGSL